MFLSGVVTGHIWYLEVNKLGVRRGDLGCYGGEGMGLAT